MPNNNEVSPLHFPFAPVPMPDLDTHFVAFSAVRHGFHSSRFSVQGDIQKALIFTQEQVREDHPLLAEGFAFFSLRDALALSIPDVVPQSGAEMMRYALERVLAASDKGYLNLYGPLLSYITRALNQPDAKGLVESVPVQYWDSTRYNPDGSNPNGDFQLEIADQRESTGQAFITLGAQDGNLDNMISCTVEVNRLPETEDDLPCVHLHFDSYCLAASFFKKGDKIIARPENGVSISNTILNNGESAWVIG